MRPKRAQRDAPLGQNMQISTALFLQTQGASSEKKVTKEAVAKILAQGLEPPSAAPTQQGSMKEVITQLMGALASEVKSKGAVLKFLQQSPLFQKSGHFQSDIKTLLSLLKNDPVFEKPLLLLQNFQKHIETIDPKVLKSQVQNSGLFFESTLANKATKAESIETIKALQREIKELLNHTSKSPALTKELSPLLERLSQPQTLKTSEVQATLKSTLEFVRQSVKEHLSFEAPLVMKTSFAVVGKLESFLQNLPLMASKIENMPEPSLGIQKATTELKELVSALKQELLKSAPPAFIEQVLPELERVLQNSSPLMTQTASTLSIESSVEEQLSLLVNRIKQEIALSEPQTPKTAQYLEKSTQVEHKILSVLKPEVFIAPEVMQKLSIHPEDSQILGDIKGVLTSLGDKLSTSTHPNAANALETTNKLLTQIEYHQLVSYIGSSTHVYIPFTWDGLKEGSMMMKQTKEDAFHCQIDLDLEQYGKINMMLHLSGENYLDMTIATQQNALSQKVRENVSDLKRALNEVGIMIQSVRLLDYKEQPSKKKEYFGDEMLNFGINITV